MRILRIVRRLLTATWLGGALSVTGLLLGAGIQACSSDGSGTTGGKLVRLHTRVVVSDAAKSTFTSDAGWDVTLTEARVAAGPFYYFDGSPAIVQREQPRSWQYAARFLGVGVAHAHPGHYLPGNAMGQMLESANVDLLGGSVDLPDGDGVSGFYRSARFSFTAPSGKGRAALEGHVAVAAGKAEKDGEAPRYFHAFADLADIEKQASQGHIDGCVLAETDVEADGTITVTVDPQVWFELVDFTEAEEASADAPAEFPGDSQPQIAFVLGTAQSSAYSFRYDRP
ncbi:MAG TPA: hypothetical protein VEQ58_13100 [Polyangiaceae bacterium]|nr:hypothetical protein [Polyangiaceae bacterium]